MALQIQHDDAGKVTGVLYADKDGKQQRAEGAHRLRRLQLDREPAAAAELGLGQIPGRPRQLARARSARNYMRHTDRLGLRDLRASRCTCTAARPWPGIVQDEAGNNPKRGFVGGYELETLSLGLPFMAAFLDPGAWGRDFTAGHGQLRQHGRHVDRRRGHAAGVQPRHAASRREGRFGLPIPNVHYDDHPNDIAMRNHAYKQGRALYEAAGARRVYETPPYPSTRPARRRSR